jgi:transposase InsO family protein
MNQGFSTLCKQNGIQQQPGEPYAPQMNGCAERSWLTVVSVVRTLLEESGLRRDLWAEAMTTAVYLLNRLPTSPLGGDTPWHAFFGKHTLG